MSTLDKKLLDKSIYDMTVSERQKYHSRRAKIFMDMKAPQIMIDKEIEMSKMTKFETRVEAIQRQEREEKEHRKWFQQYCKDNPIREEVVNKIYALVETVVDPRTNHPEDFEFYTAYAVIEKEEGIMLEQYQAFYYDALKKYYDKWNIPEGQRHS